MQRIFALIGKYLKNAYFWLLDYGYVCYWQMYYLFVRKDISSFYRGRTITKSQQIIIIPGIYESWRFMGPVIRLLAQNGYKVHVVETLGYNYDTVEAMAANIRLYIEENNVTNSVIVAHSKGGLVGKLLLADKSVGTKIKGVVAISTPFSGSAYAYLAPTKSLRVFLPNSPILSSLRANKKVNNKIVSIYGQFDPHIPKGSYLEDANNIQVTASGHFRILNDEQVHACIIDSLERL